MNKNDYGKLINGKLIIGIPSTYKRVDGKTISNYDLQSIDDSEPFVWTWKNWAFLKHTVKAVVFNSEGVSSSDEIIVQKFF